MMLNRLMTQEMTRHYTMMMRSRLSMSVLAAESEATQPLSALNSAGLAIGCKGMQMTAKTSRWLWHLLLYQQQRVL